MVLKITADEPNGRAAKDGIAASLVKSLEGIAANMPAVQGSQGSAVAAAGERAAKAAKHSPARQAAEQAANAGEESRQRFREMFEGYTARPSDLEAFSATPNLPLVEPADKQVDEDASQRPNEITYYHKLTPLLTPKGEAVATLGEFKVVYTIAPDDDREQLIQHFERVFTGSQIPGDTPYVQGTWYKVIHPDYYGRNIREFQVTRAYLLNVWHADENSPSLAVPIASIAYLHKFAPVAFIDKTLGTKGVYKVTYTGLAESYPLDRLKNHFDRTFLGSMLPGQLPQIGESNFSDTIREGERTVTLERTYTAQGWSSSLG